MNRLENLETVPQKVVDQKVVILKSRLDQNDIKLLSEEKKKCLFGKPGILKKRGAKEKDIVLIGLNKYYEPYILIGGKYSIDYCKKHLIKIETDNNEKRLFIGGEEKNSEPCSPIGQKRMFKVVGEERCHYGKETFIVLDRLKREVPPEKIFFAPFEEKQENTTYDIRKVNITLEEEIDLIKTKIVKRPPNSDFIIKEIFEITDRLIVYNPVYELVFQDVKTSEEAIIIIEGVSGNISLSRTVSSNNQKLRYFEEDFNQRFSPSPSLQEEPENNNTDISELKTMSVMPSDTIANNPYQNDSNIKENNRVISSQTRSDSDAEKALYLARDLLKRLGFKKKIAPLKVTPENDAYTVELYVEDRTAKVLVNTKTSEIKEYDIQNDRSY